MAIPFFRKSLLSLAIMASLPVSANTLELTGTPVITTSPAFNEDVTIRGAVQGTEYGLMFLDDYFSEGPAGSFINQASIQASATNATALKIVPSYYVTWPHAFMQDFRNSGVIRSQGTNSKGLQIGQFTDPWNSSETNMLGQLDNSGTIEASGSHATAISLEVFFSYIAEITNSGHIQAQGDGARAISCFIGCNFKSFGNTGVILAIGASSKGLDYSNALFPSTYNLLNQGLIQSIGDNSRTISTTGNAVLLNDFNGLIRAEGAGSQALTIEDLDYQASDSPGYITNHGAIESSGYDSAAVVIDHPARVGELRNEFGSITARGDNATAIRIGSGHPIDEESSTGLNILSESGLILAEGNAIEVGATPDIYVGSAPWVRIQANNSLLISQQAAVRGSGNTDVELTHSLVQGNLLGLNQLNLNAGTRLDSPVIEARQVRIGQAEFVAPHTRMQGDLTLLASGTLDFSIAPNTDTRAALLAIDGQADLGERSQIRVKPVSEDFRFAAPRQLTLVEADQIIDRGLSVISLSQLLRVYSYSISHNQVLATIGGLSTAEATEQLRDFGASGHVLPAYAAFYGSVLGQLDADDPVFQRFTEGSSQQLLELAVQLTPDASGGTVRSHAGNQNLLANSLQQRGSQLRQGLSSGDGLSETGAWVTLLDSDANQSSRGDVRGYDADSQGILLGADGKLNEQTTLGLAYSYLDSDIHGNSSKTESDAHSLSLYGSWEQQAWFVDGNLSLGLADNDSTRHVAGTRAKGDYDSQLYGAALIGGYRYPLQQNLELEPRLGARYNRIESDSYREHGSAAALAIGDQRFEAGELGAGIRLSGLAPMGKGQIKPQLTLMVWHDLMADQGSQSSSFLIGGSPFVTSSSVPTRDSYEAKLAVDYELGSITLGLGYDYLGKADFSSDTLSAKVRYDF